MERGPAAPRHRALRRGAASLALLALVGTTAAAAAPDAAARLVRPNVVLVLTDDQTMESVARMPYVSAPSQPWVRFENAVVQNALCCPARVTLLTGQYDTHTGVMHNDQTARYDAATALPTWLQAVGYRTALVGKLHNGYLGGPPDPGWTRWVVPYTTAQYAQYDYPLNVDGVRTTRGSSPADYQVDVLGQFGSQFIADSARLRQPFFLLFSPTATHAPWQASPTRVGRYGTAAVSRSPSFNQADGADPAWVRRLAQQDPALMDTHRRREWDAAISIDDTLRRLDGSLRSAGVYDKTVVIFMTDNGYSFGEHRWVTKRCAYEECIRTPLLVRYPGQAAAADRHLVSNIDVAGTIADITGARPAVRQDGRSILPFVLRPGTADPTWRTGALLHWPGGNHLGVGGKFDSVPQFWAVRTTRFKYVELVTGERELYDLFEDPYELRNRVALPRYRTQVAGLRAQLSRLKAEANAELSPPDPVTSVSVPGQATTVDVS